ncbi:MAG: helix-turn-helix transcriptional regulator [Acidimicrobiia bacterium]
MASEAVDLLTAVSSPMNVGATIDALRRHCGLTTKALAQMASIKRSTLHGRIAGSDATASELDRLARVFNVPIAVLFLERDVALRWVLDHPARRPTTVGDATVG